MLTGLAATVGVLDIGTEVGTIVADFMTGSTVPSDSDAPEHAKLAKTSTNNPKIKMFKVNLPNKISFLFYMYLVYLSV